MMTNNDIHKIICSWFPADTSWVDLPNENDDSVPVTDTNVKEELPNVDRITFSEEQSQYLNISVDSELLHELMTKLKEDNSTSFDLLFCLTGVDWGKELGVVYHLESTTHRHIIVVKVQTADRDNPVFDTVSDIWSTADFHEREVYDFFGVKFTNHPNLKRLFLTDDWVGFPLRKDYVDEKNMIIK